MKIPGIRYLEINLNGKGFERSLLWQLSFWSFLYVVDASRHFGHQVSYRTSCPTHGNLLGSHADYITLIGSKLVIFILLGYRMKAISILGREVMQPRGLVGLGHDSIDFCGPEIAQVSKAKARTLFLCVLLESRLFKSSLQKPVTRCLFTVHKARTGLDCSLL